MPVAPPYDPYAIANPWWQQQRQQPQQQPQQYGQPPAPQQPGQSANSSKPPSLLEMGLNIGRMTRPQYDQAIKGTPPGQQQGLAMVSPWAWLGSMGGGTGGGRP